MAALDVLPDWLRRYCTLQVATPAMTADEAEMLAAALKSNWLRAEAAHNRAVRHGHRCPRISGGYCELVAMVSELFALWADATDDAGALRHHPEIVALLHDPPEYEPPEDDLPEDGWLWL